MFETQAKEYLHSLGAFGIQPGLTRIRWLLDDLGQPEKKFRSIHVAGTNGKGSTTAFVASVLHGAGLRTGMYTSPHLTDYPERFQIDGKEIAWDALGKLLIEVRGAADRMLATGLENATEFEVLTAAAFLWFAREKVDFAVIEVGLGGTLDSTNVITPKVCVITNVGLDHTDRCGSTVEEIARHKAGIIKPGVPVVTGTLGSAREVIRQVALEQDSPLYALGIDFGVIDGTPFNSGRSFRLQMGAEKPVEFTIPLRGRHQADNAALALVACRLLAEGEPRLRRESMAAGLAATSWPGRFEVFGDSPPVVVDGAHNSDSARALRQTLDETYGARPVVFLFGVLADKDYHSVIRILFRPGDRAVVVRPHSDRAADPADIAREINAVGITAEIAFDAKNAYERSLELAVPEALVCVTGSLYMIGELRELVRQSLQRGQNNR